jgi:hypothetical protein
MSNWLQVLAGTLGGVGQGYVQGKTQQRTLDEQRAEREQDKLYRDAQLGLQQRQLTLQEQSAAAAAAERQRQQVLDDEARQRTLADRQAQSLSPTELLTPAMAATQRQFGQGTVTKTLDLPMLMGGMGRGGVAPVRTPVGETRRMTPEERLLAENATNQAKFFASNPDLPPEVRQAFEAYTAGLSGKPTFGFSGDALLTPDQRTARLRDAGNEEIRVRNATRPVSAAPEPAWTTMSILGADGQEQLVQVDPRSGAVRPVQLPAGAAPKGAATKPPTGAQDTALIFFNRMNQAIKDLDSLDVSKLSGPDIALINGPNLMGLSNMMTSETGQKYKQAMRAFTEARLRKDSGAAIPESEFVNDRMTYFPQPGDGPEVAAQKRIARNIALDAMANAAGPAYERYYGQRYVPGQLVRGGGESFDIDLSQPSRPTGAELLLRSGGR